MGRASIFVFNGFNLQTDSTLFADSFKKSKCVKPVKPFPVKKGGRPKYYPLGLIRIADFVGNAKAQIIALVQPVLIQLSRSERSANAEHWWLPVATRV